MKWRDEILHTPITATRKKFKSERRRLEYIAEETAKRDRALFQRYHIPDDWPDSIRWEWLARHLAGEFFAGCRVIERGRGGMRKVRRLRIAEQRVKLFAQFERYVRDYHIAHPHWTRNRVSAAKTFIEDNWQACTEVRLTTARSFLKALNAARHKRQAPQQSAAPSGRVSRNRTPQAQPPKDLTP
jgi:hypothetical protein